MREQGEKSSLKGWFCLASLGGPPSKLPRGAGAAGAARGSGERGFGPAGQRAGWEDALLGAIRRGGGGLG